MKRLLFASLMSLTGCIGVIQDSVRQQAAVDHHCPLEDVKVVRMLRINPASAEVNACGKVRTYRDVSGDHDHMPNWVDVTNTLL
jgi:glutaredoxin 2